MAVIIWLNRRVDRKIVGCFVGKNWPQAGGLLILLHKLRYILHSGQEARYILLGQVKSGRLLFIVFTIRVDKIRVISARDLNKKERKLYEEVN